MKNLTTTLKDINSDVKSYNSTVEQAQKKFWTKHPTYKKVVTGIAVTTVLVEVVQYLNNEGVFDSLKKRAKLALLKSLKNEVDEVGKDEYETLVSKIRKGEKLTLRDKAMIREYRDKDMTREEYTSDHGLL